MSYYLGGPEEVMTDRSCTQPRKQPGHRPFHFDFSDHDHTVDSVFGAGNGRVAEVIAQGGNSIDILDFGGIHI